MIDYSNQVSHLVVIATTDYAGGLVWQMQYREYH